MHREMVGFDLFTQGLTPPGSAVQLRDDLVRGVFITGKLGDPQLSLQTKPFHRGRFVSGRKAFALFATFDKSQFTASVESGLTAETPRPKNFDC
jgi:hypothetical protein